MAAVEAVLCMYVDEVPVMFDVADVEPYRTWYKPLVRAGRARFGIWAGGYPLRGPLLDESMRLYETVVYPLIPLERRRPLDRGWKLHMPDLGARRGA